MLIASPSPVLAGLLLAAAASTALGADNKLDYGRDIRPILSENCFHCHGQDARKRMAGLRLDTIDGATGKRGKDRPPALTPGNSAASGIYLRITADQPAMRMPPAHSNRTLTPAQIATLKRWIDEGGAYSKHWAFTPPVQPAPPRVSQPRWIKQPLDAFVLQRLDAERLGPSPPASPAQWLRRVSLDLTGLPPTPNEIAAFESDALARQEASYAAAADRLLASPRYGERMAMDWLDVARYADTHGFNNDASRSMWRWRDWVIESFNANLRYDRFLTEQLAGDLLPDPTLDQRIATGYGRNHVINSEGGIIDEEYRVEYVADRVRTLGMSWLGLTLECARCHDHKYDPITQRDHYRFFAFFNNVPEIGEDGRVANAVPIMPAPTAAQRSALADLETSIARLTGQLETREAQWRNRVETPVAASAKVAPPGEPAVHLPCEQAAAGYELAPGIEGQACVLAAAGKPQLPAIPISKRGALTLAAWLNPARTDRDSPLLSAIDYARNPAATTYGNGIELRLVGGELEFRFGQRFPAYSIRVRSEGAGLTAEQWRHIALVYTGSEGQPANRMRAAWVRMYVDGEELPTRTINEGGQLPDEKSDKPSETRFRLAWDNHPEADAPRFSGRIDEIGAWTKRLTSGEIAQLFTGRALPYARLRAGKATPVEQRWLRQSDLAVSDPVFAEAHRRRARLRDDWLALRRDIPTVMVMQELPIPRATHLLLRGAYNAPGERVEPGVPEELLGSWPAGAPKNRLGLAQWLTKPDHPLTARVVVNRFWQQLFGQGLVKTSENFGAQGSWPSHPGLLDHLARSFVDSGWDTKALLKQIVLSATYRQDSSASAALIARDPENQLLARGPRFRLPAEIIRDQALATAGLLTHQLGGPSVFPYQPAGLYNGIVVAADYPGTSYTESKGPDLYRRSLYTFWKRTVPHPTMTVFDAPDREFCIVRRSTTNTPLQALTLLNDPIFVEAARKFAERAIREGGSSPAARLSFAFRLATGRAADASELAVLVSTFERMLALYRADEPGAKSFLGVGASPRDESIAISELAAYAAVTNMILNLDEVVTKG